MDLLQANSTRWQNCKINQNRSGLFNVVAKRLTDPTAVSRYRAVEVRTGVPWWFIAVVHEREASQSWNANIAQGDRWDTVSRHVPAGRGPFSSWEDAAVDALVRCPPYAARNKDWSVASALTMLEQYNGLGYYRRGIPSPYIWAGTNQYSHGKYVADGAEGFDPNAVDTQLGCAGLLKAMNIFDKSTPKAPQMGGGAVIVAGGAAATQYPEYAWVIIPAVLLAALAVYFIIKKRK